MDQAASPAAVSVIRVAVPTPVGSECVCRARRCVSSRTCSPLTPAPHPPARPPLSCLAPPRLPLFWAFPSQHHAVLVSLHTSVDWMGGISHELNKPAEMRWSFVCGLWRAAGSCPSPASLRAPRCLNSLIKADRALTVTRRQVSFSPERFSADVRMALESAALKEPQDPPGPGRAG